MAKDPAFLFYPGDWLGGTMGMSFEEKGAYFELLVMQWHKSRISQEDAIKVVGEKLWHKLSHKFEADGGGFFNKRLEVEKQKRSKHSEKQSVNAKKRWNKDECDGIANAMPLENENINRNENKNIVVYKGGAGEQWDSVKKRWAHDFRYKEKICTDKNLDPSIVEKRMTEFLAELELKEDYKDISALKKHFVNWNNKRFNGSATHQSNFTNGSAVKLGTSAARIDALKKF